MLALAALVSCAFLQQPAQDPALCVGDPAPAFVVARWLRGEPRAALERGKVHVVEFWATWCGPCIAGMPHLSRLQRELGPRGLQVIGVAPRPDEWGHDLSSIEALMARKGEELAYSIALDAESDSKDGYQGVFRGRTIESWMGGARVGAMPIAFVIDREGTIAAIAPPLEIDGVVRACLEGTWDRARAAKEYRAVLAARRELEQVKDHLRKGEHELALALSEELLAGPLWQDARYLGALANDWYGAEATGEGLALALRAVQRASELAQSGDPGALGLLARLRARNGELGEAERVQALALALSEGELRAAIERDFAAEKARRAR